MVPASEQQAPAEEAEHEAFSPVELVSFGYRAARQHLVACILVAVGIITVGTIVVTALPPVYDATCKIFVQDSGTLTSALASGHDRYRSVDGARGLEEYILARDNLLSIVREAKLYEKWPRTRSFPMQIKDRVAEYIRGPISRKYMERVLTEMLTTSISAARDGESVRIHAQWRDGQSAYDITRLVERNFLAARAAHDFGPIRRAIPFLEEQLQEADQAIESAVNKLQAAKGESKGATAKAEVTAEEELERARDATAHLAGLSRQLSEVRREQRALMEPRRRLVTELKLQLIEMRAQYSADHPLLRQQEARIAALTDVPPELAALRERESEILNALSDRGSKPSAVAAMLNPPTAQDSELAPLRARLGAALRKSDEIAARLENARIELATAEADFKHRYVVVEEPEVPDKPLKNKKPIFYAVVVLAGLLLGFATGGLLELRKGQIVEPWQVRSLGVELLGEVSLQKLLPRNKA